MKIAWVLCVGCFAMSAICLCLCGAYLWDHDHAWFSMGLNTFTFFITGLTFLMHAKRESK